MEIVNGYKVYTKDELAKILEEHAKLLKDDGGNMADLSGANLSWAYLSRADLSMANLSGANLSWADLSRADLSRANLSRADIDYSVFPLWFGGSKFKCSAKLVYQLLAHIMTLEVTDESEEFAQIKKEIEKYAKKSHRWNDLTK